MLQAGTYPPWVVAHRGASEACPENTLAAIRAAAAMPGVRAIEFDVQLSRDEVVVVAHDETLERLNGDVRAIRDLTWDELQQVDAGSWKNPAFAGERIPRLEEVLESVDGPALFIEIKVHPADREAGRHYRLGECVLQCLAGWQGECAILSFDRDVLFRISTLDAEAALVLNADDPTVVDGWRGIGGKSELNTISSICATIDMDVMLLSEFIAGPIHAAGFALLTFTCNDEERLSRALAAGVNGIISDRPDWLAAKIEDRTSLS
jgi:glycerophosphoryl diester phosphodiesterase